MKKNKNYCKTIPIVITVLLLVPTVSTFLIPTTSIAVIQQPKPGGSLRIGMPKEWPNQFNPIIGTATGLLYIMWPGLIQWDENYNYIPDLAESWEVSEDGLTYTFHLREDGKWSDGEPITAADIEFSARVFSEQCTFWEYTFDPIQAPDPNTITGDTLAPGAIETPDPYTVIMHLNEPYAPGFLYMGGWWMLPKHVFEGVDFITEKDIFLGPLVGGGPFVLEEYIPGERWTMVANEYYYAGRPPLDSLIFIRLENIPAMEIALMNGDIDYLWGFPPKDAAVLAENPNLVVASNPSWEIAYIILNFNERLADGSINPVANLRVRKAIYQAVDLKAILEATVGKGFYTVANQPQPPFVKYMGESCYNEELPSPLYPYDPEAAKQLLDDAGYIGSPRMTLKFVVHAGDPVWLDIAQFFQSYLSEVGIRVDLMVVEETIRYTLVYEDPPPKTWHLARGRCDTAPDVDVAVYYPLYGRKGMAGPGGWNAGGYNNSEVSDLIEKGWITIDPVERAKIYKDIASIVTEELALFWLYYQDQTMAWSKDFEGLILGASMTSWGGANGLTNISIRNIWYVPAQVPATTPATPVPEKFEYLASLAMLVVSALLLHKQRKSPR